MNSSAPILVGLLVALSAGLGAAAATAMPAISSLNGDRLVLRHDRTSTILAFWRADCGPCLMELQNAKAYADAARPGRFLFVGLQDAGALRAAVLKAGAPLTLAARVDGSPKAILTAYGGAPARLPLAVAFDAAGRPCDRHTGLLGTDLIQTWAKKCGVAHARG